VSSSAKKAGSKTIEVTRDRHTVVSVTHPLDIDIDDPTHLRDEQFLQIFFNVLIMELLMGCVWANAITITSNGALHLRNLMIVGFSTAILQIFVVIISRAIFRSGNRALHNASWATASEGDQRKARRKYAACWLLNLLAYLGMCWVVLAYAFCFGDRKTNDMVFSWGYGLGVSWLVTERPHRTRGLGRHCRKEREQLGTNSHGAAPNWPSILCRSH
jgi:hypothetical protein